MALQGKTSKTSKIRETHERNGDLADHLFGDKWECGYNMIQAFISHREINSNIVIICNIVIRSWGCVRLQRTVTNFMIDMGHMGLFENSNCSHRAATFHRGILGMPETVKIRQLTYQKKY